MKVLDRLPRVGSLPEPRAQRRPSPAVSRVSGGAEAPDSLRRASRLGHQPRNLAPSTPAQTRTLQRAVIPVYKRNPVNDQARDKDRAEVDQFALDNALAADAGTIRGPLPGGGDVSGIPNNERIIIAGHGNVGSIQGYSGSEVAAYLKNSWRLARGYTGTIHLSSCKSGDSGYIAYLNPSLVAAVSDNLFGYSANVAGLKGNVITGGVTSAQPGVDRSVGDDAAFATYKARVQEFRTLIAERDKAIDDEAGLDFLSARNASNQAGMLELEKGRLEREAKHQSAVVSVFSAVSSAISGTPSRLSTIDAEIAAKRQLQATLQARGEVRRDAVILRFRDRIAALHQLIDAVGQPFGTAAITVTSTPADRNTLANNWIDFLERESAPA